MIKKSLLVLCIMIITVGKSFAMPEDVAYVVLDYNNGQVLFEKNAHKRMYPASITKLMTLFIIFDKLQNKEISLDQKIKISYDASRQVPSKLGLPEGSTITIRDAIISTIIKSENDMAYALAENIAGSKENFVDLMNQKAQELGLTETHFVNPTGLHDDNHYSTAYDLANLGRIFMIHHNQYYPLFSIPEFKWGNRVYRSTNKLLSSGYIDGMKTGYTSKAGFNLLSSGYIHNIRVVSVLMGYKSSLQRNQATEDIIKKSLVVSYRSKRDVVEKDYHPNDAKSSSILILNSNTERNNNLYNIVMNEDQYNYNIRSIPYIEKIKEDEIVPKIKPIIKSYIHKVNKNFKYMVQVGAFSSYYKALNISYNVTNKKDVSKVLTKQKISIDKKSDLYIARFKHLDKNVANNACRKLKNSGVECLVIKS